MMQSPKLNKKKCSWCKLVVNEWLFTIYGVISLRNEESEIIDDGHITLPFYNDHTIIMEWTSVT